MRRHPSNPVRRPSILAAVLILIAGFTIVGRATAETPANANSPLGIDLAGISYWSPNSRS